MSKLIHQLIVLIFILRFFRELKNKNAFKLFKAYVWDKLVFLIGRYVPIFLIMCLIISQMGRYLILTIISNNFFVPFFPKVRFLKLLTFQGQVSRGMDYFHSLFIFLNIDLFCSVLSFMFIIELYMIHYYINQ